MNISQVFEERTKSHNTALIYYGRKFSYRDLGKFARLFAQVFINLGVSKGDRIALMMSNVPQFVFAYYGAMLAGATVVPINLLSLPRSYRADSDAIRVPDEIRAQIADAKPALVLAFDFYFPLLKALEQEELAASKTKVLLTTPQEFMSAILKRLAPLKLKRQGRSIKIEHRPFWLLDDFGDLLAYEEKRRVKPFAIFPGMALDENDIAQIQYTGGTTGTPKGAVLTHKNLLSNIRQANECLGDFLEHGKEVVLGVLPFFHMYGLTACMQITLLEQEGTIVLVADPQDIKQWAKWIKEYKVSIIPSIPRIYETLVGARRDLLREDVFSSVKLFLNGAGVLPAKTRRTFEEISEGKIIEGYGLSEASPVVSVCTPNDFREGSIGKPLPDTEVRIVDEEIVVRGPQVMQGYWNKPMETAEVLHEGWLYTGDAGYLDKDGFLYITDRIKDMAKVGGENVYPSRVEAALLKHPMVQDAAVVGVPDEKRGERLAACVVWGEAVLEGSDMGVDLRRLLRSYLTDRLAPFEIPSDFYFIESLDLYKNQLGKVLKRKIREAIQNGKL